MPAVQPKFSDTPAPEVRPAPDLGAHTDEVLRQLAGLSAERIAKLRVAGTILSRELEKRCSAGRARSTAQLDHRDRVIDQIQSQHRRG